MSTTEAAALRIGGLQGFSTLDCPGALAAVVFVQGCPWRCGYCHNPQLQPRAVAAGVPVPDWSTLHAWLERRRGLLDCVVFSGGEPTLDPALPAALDAVRALGFGTGLHSAGLSPRRLSALLPRLDWVGLDIKAPLGDEGLHARIVGRRGGSAAVRASLGALLASGIRFECRTTAHPSLLPDAALLALAEGLAAAGVRRYALQVCRPAGALAALPAPGRDYPAPATLARLHDLMPAFELRRAHVP